MFQDNIDRANEARRRARARARRAKIEWRRESRLVKAADGKWRRGGKVIRKNYRY